jgi:hypothetical protein
MGDIANAIYRHLRTMAPHQLERMTAIQLKEAADEIARLRLTDAERFVLREVRDIYADEDDLKCNEIAAVIDGLLERLG